MERVARAVGEEMPRHVTRALAARAGRARAPLCSDPPWGVPSRRSTATGSGTLGERAPRDDVHILRPGLRAALEAILEAGNRVEFDLGASGSRLCRIHGPAEEVTGAGGTVEEAATDALRLWVAAR